MTARLCRVINSCILMTYAPRQWYRKGRAPESRATVTAAFEQLPDAVERLAHDCSISPRQAYRYLQHAQRLKEPVAVGESKLAFTVKLPRSLIQRVRLYASVKKLSISEVVNRALLALLPNGRGRGRG